MLLQHVFFRILKVYQLCPLYNKLQNDQFNTTTYADIEAKYKIT
jgi:hypothetical protein